MPELVLKLGDNVVQTYVFEKDIMGIGRSRDNDIVIENLSVSRNHARIRNQAGKFVLTDLNSANGTYVNGVKVTKTEIVDGDTISIGKHKLHFTNKVISEEEKIVDAFGQDRTMLVDRAPQPVLCVTEGKLKGTEFAITKFETAIGKAQENDIVIGDDWFLSKKQAVIYRKGGDFELHDLGGFRKTKVNGQPLNDPHILRPGDVVELGNIKCVFQFAGELAPSGRVPQEMASEDSIFSSGAGLEPIPTVGTPAAQATERDESAESYDVVVEGLPEDAAAPAALAQAAPEASAAESPAEEVAEEIAVAAPAVPDNPPPAPARQGPTGKQARRKRDRLRDVAGVAGRVDNGSVYGVEKSPEADAEEPVATDNGVSEAPGEPEPNPEPVLEAEAAAFSPERNPVEQIIASYSSAQQAESSAAAAGPALEDAPLRWSGDGKSDEEIAADPGLQKEVTLWEAALRNKSQIIRRQAAKTLKKLTGRDYEI